MYTGFNLRMHAYGMRAWDLFKTLTQKHEIEKQSINKKTLILAIKHDQNIKEL